MPSDEETDGSGHPDRSSHPKNTMVEGPKGPMLVHYCEESATGMPKPGSAERCPHCKTRADGNQTEKSMSEFPIVSSEEQPNGQYNMEIRRREYLKHSFHVFPEEIDPLIEELESIKDGRMTWEEAQEAVREFANGEVKAITPMAGEMVVLYDEGNYGPNGRHSPPNVELITKADSIWDTWTDDGSMSFRSIIEKYPVEVLEEKDLTHTGSEANAKAYVGVPPTQIQSKATQEDGDER